MKCQNLCILFSSSRIQTYFSKIICLLWDLSLQLLHGPTWIALSGCQSGIIFVNVVSVLLSLRIHTHTHKKKSKLSCWSENNKYTHFTRRKKLQKGYDKAKFYSYSCHVCEFHCWLHHIQVSTEFSSAKQYQPPFVLSSSVAFSFTLFALSPFARYLCFLSNKTELVPWSA